jgi:hypothetical protein
MKAGKGVKDGHRRLRGNTGFAKLNTTWLPKGKKPDSEPNA